MPTSDKDFVPAALLCYFLGTLGMHRFYTGKIDPQVGLDRYLQVFWLSSATGGFRIRDHPGTG